MYEEFKLFLKAAEMVGKVDKMTMYETYASIDVVAKDGKKMSVSVTIKEG